MARPSPRSAAAGARLKKLPASADKVPSSPPQSGSIGIDDFLPGLVMSGERCASPVFFPPEALEDPKHKVQPTCILGG